MTDDETMPNSHTLYMIEYLEEDSASGVTREWFTTFNKGLKRLRQLKLMDEASVKTVDIPKAKIRLCTWLNSIGKVG
jgi:hypothetical protein